MSKFAVRLLSLAITASVTVAPAMAETAKKHHSHIRRPLVASDPGQVWLPTGPKVFPEASIAGHGLPMAMTPIEGFGGSNATTQRELKRAFSGLTLFRCKLSFWAFLSKSRTLWTMRQSQTS